MEHYPVKKRGIPRQLNPNWAGVAWLEAQSLESTEVVDTYEASDPGVYVQRARGWMEARRRDNHARPMFSLLGMTSGSAWQIVYPNPCPDCDDWSRTSQCATHPERGVERFLDTRRQRAYSEEPIGLAAAIESVPAPVFDCSRISWEAPRHTYRAVIVDELGMISYETEED